MVTYKCNLCRDVKIMTAVNKLRATNRIADNEALILQYLIAHKDKYIDEYELRMLITGVSGDDVDLNAVTNIIEDMRRKLVCIIGVDLIERKPEFGYMLSSCCALFQ